MWLVDVSYLCTSSPLSSCWTSLTGVMFCVRFHLQAVLLLQTDITARALMETRMAALTESQVSPYPFSIHLDYLSTSATLVFLCFLLLMLTLALDPPHS